MENAIGAFYRLRQIDGIEKKPATRELINWIRALQADPDFQAQGAVQGARCPFWGCCLRKARITSGPRQRESEAPRTLLGR